MPEKRHTMNDMIVTKKPVAQKQVISVSKKNEKTIERPVERIVPKLRIVEEEMLGPGDDEFLYNEEVPRKNRSGCLLWMIAVVCSIALVMGIGGLFAHAEISIIPKQWSGTIDTTITLSQSQGTNDVFFGVATKKFSIEKVVPSTGQSLDEAKATGTVRFYNSNKVPKTIPTKTEIVSSTGKKYTLNKTITIPAQGIKNPGQVDVGVTAVIVGSEGNSGMDDFVFSKQDKALVGITIRSISEMTGGVSTSESLADPAKVAAASEQIKNEFKNSRVFTDRLSEQIPDTMIPLPVVLPENMMTITVDTKQEDGVHIVGTQTVSLLLVERTGFARVLGGILGVPKGMKLTIEDSEGLSSTTSGIVAGQPIPQKIQVRMTGTGTVVGVVDQEAVKNKVVGLSRRDVKKYLDGILEIDRYTLRMRPFWRRILPADLNDIEVVD